MPIRLWSVVVSQEVTRPRRQSTVACGASTLTATRTGSLRLLQVADDLGDLGMVPVAADRGHRAEAGRAAGSEQLRDVRGLERPSLQRRAVIARAVHPVALGADARVGLGGDRLAAGGVGGEE